MDELQSIDELEFVAECKSTGEKLAFTMADLWGWDDETVFLDDSIYLERPKEINWAIVVSGEFGRTINPEYNIRLRTEEDKDVKEPLKLLSIKLYPGFRFDAVFSNRMARSGSLSILRRWVNFMEDGESFCSEEEFRSAVMSPRGICLPDGSFISAMELWKASGECFAIEEWRRKFGEFNCDIGAGWESLLSEMCAAIEKAYQESNMPIDIVVEDVKEKYGKLRFYFCFQGKEGTRQDFEKKELHDRICKIVKDGEEKSGDICEICGQLGQFRTDIGWIRPLCDACYKSVIERKRTYDIPYKKIL